MRPVRIVIFKSCCGFPIKVGVLILGVLFAAAGLAGIILTMEMIWVHIERSECNEQDCTVDIHAIYLIIDIIYLIYSTFNFIAGVMGLIGVHKRSICCIVCFMVWLSIEMMTSLVLCSLTEMRFPVVVAVVNVPVLSVISSTIIFLLLLVVNSYLDELVEASQDAERENYNNIDQCEGIDSV